MNSEPKNKLLKLLKDPILFNRDYGLKSNTVEGIKIPKESLLGLKFERWNFHKVTFDGTNLERCIFNDVNFIKCVFEFAEIKKSNFKNCRFDDCTFTASKIDSNHFEGGIWTKNISQGKMGFEQQFENNIFSGTQFTSNTLVETSFKGSKFDNALFTENDFTRTYLGDCIFAQSKILANKLEDATFYDSKIEDGTYVNNNHIGNFLRTKIERTNFKLITNLDKSGEAFDGATLTDSKIDLTDFQGSFGVGAGASSLYENLKSKKQNFVLGDLGSSLSENTYRNISCETLDLSFTICNKCLFENIDADMILLETANLKNCIFRNVRIREFVNFTDGKFENVKWENITIDPNCEIRTDGSSYKDKKPF